MPIRPDGYYGFRVAEPGDFDGDGIDDLVISELGTLGAVPGAARQVLSDRRALSVVALQRQDRGYAGLWQRPGHRRLQRRRRRRSRDRRQQQCQQPGRRRHRLYLSALGGRRLDRADLDPPGRRSATTASTRPATSSASRWPAATSTMTASTTSPSACRARTSPAARASPRPARSRWCMDRHRA